MLPVEPVVVLATVFHGPLPATCSTIVTGSPARPVSAPFWAYISPPIRLTAGSVKFGPPPPRYVDPRVMLVGMPAAGAVPANAGAAAPRPATPAVTRTAASTRTARMLLP